MVTVVRVDDNSRTLLDDLKKLRNLQFESKVLIIHTYMSVSTVIENEISIPEVKRKLMDFMCALLLIW